MLETKPVQVPEGGRATVEFLSLDVPYGRNQGTVKIDSADALRARRRLLFFRGAPDPRHALFVHEADDTRALLYFKAALEASGQAAFAIDAAVPGQTANVSPSKYAFVALSDVGALPPAFEEQLRAYVRNGGSVLVALGHNSLSRPRVPVAGDRHRRNPLRGPRRRSFSDRRVSRSIAPFHPAGQSLGRRKILPRHSRGTGQRPRSGAPGRRNAPTDRPVRGPGPHSDLRLHFRQHRQRFSGARFLRALRQPDGTLPGATRQRARQRVRGRFEELRDPQEKGTAVDVLDPKGERVFTLAEAAKAQNIQFTQTGFYDIRRPNGRNELVAVNTDRHESDLTPTSPETLDLWQNTANGTSEAGGAAATQDKPFSLWWYMMLAVLALVLAESLLGNRHLSVDKEAA